MTFFPFRQTPHLVLFLVAATALPAGATTLLPDFSAATFLPGGAITNVYFPLSTTPSVVKGTSPSDERAERVSVGAGPNILGVDTSTLRDRAYEGNLLVEETFDFYAQDTLGNVWYFGEDTTSYYYDADGNLINTDNHSQWRSGVNGGQPGYALTANPTVGLAYYQEFSPADGAVDEAVTLSTTATVDVGWRSFTDVIVVLETTALEPGIRGLKYYAAGFGIIREDERVDENYLNPELVSTLVGPAAVPLPASLPLLAGAVAGLAAFARRRRSAPLG